MFQEAEDRIARISEQLERGETPAPITVRELLSWFGSQRRGSWIVPYIRGVLGKHRLVTTPDFEGAYIDSPVAFARPVAEAQEPETPGSQDSGSRPDPTYRIGRLASANRVPVFVGPDDTVTRAITLMLENDFSQLPVMTSERDVKGMITWKTIGSLLSLGCECSYVRQCTERHAEIDADRSLFEAIGTIVENQYVLVRNATKVICGIVTTADLSLQFRQLGEPFLLLGEIENYIRGMIAEKFTVSDLAQVRNPVDGGRTIERVSDLTLGEYCRLLENPANWERVGVRIDRVEFNSKLGDVRRIRNDVMHFDPDGIPDEDLKVLRDFARFLQGLAAIRAI